MMEIAVIRAILEGHEKIVNLPDYQHLAHLTPSNIPGKKKK